jgi:HSP20 family protein
MKRNEMTLWRDNPFAPLMELQRDIDRLFGDYLTPTTGALQGQMMFNPACDIEEREDHYVISMDVPGVSKDDIRIEMQGNQLMISGVRKEETRRDEKNLRRIERSYGTFQRVFTLPQGVDADKIEASCENGVLMLAVPKTAEAKARQIRIGESKGLLGREKPVESKVEQQAGASRKTA